jgi:two-component system chemotaxis sensor kinase CheA
MGKFRDGMPVTAEAATLILRSIDRIKEILAGLEATETEPEGNDEELIVKLHEMVARGMAAMSAPASLVASAAAASEPAPPTQSEPVELSPVANAPAVDALVKRTPERPLRPGEVSLDELERAFRETAVEVVPPTAPEVTHAPAPKPETRATPVFIPPRSGADKPVVEAEVPEADKIANQSIRVNVDTLEHLMTMVSELVLTRNQLLEISRRNEDTEFKVPHLASMPIIALSSLVSPAAIERGRQAGFHDYVAKFDRPGLIAALKEQTAEINRQAA